VNVPPARIGRRHIPLIKPNPFREGDTTKNTTQQPPFSPEQKISDLKKETTILDSTKDQSHQDHHLIHYTPLVQREREIHTCKIRNWNLYSILVCILFDLQLLWLPTVISRWTPITLLWYNYVILLSCLSRFHWRGRCRGLVRCDVSILFHLFVHLWLTLLYTSHQPVRCTGYQF
jgi:hypothetical protein